MDYRIKTAKEGAITAKQMLQTFRLVMGNIDGLSLEQQRGLLHLFFDSIEILPEPRPNGKRVRRVRFRLPISLNGAPPAYELDTHENYGDDDDTPPDDDPPSGGGPKPAGPEDSPSGGDEVPLEIDLSDRDISRAGNCVPNPMKGFKSL